MRRLSIGVATILTGCTWVGSEEHLEASCAIDPSLAGCEADTDTDADSDTDTDADSDTDTDADTDADTDTGVPACGPDASEPNDDFGSPVALPTSAVTSISGNEDWWLIPVAANQAVQVTVTMDALIGDLDLYAFDSGGVLIRQSAFYGFDVEQLVLDNASAAPRVFAIKVEHWSGQPCVPYTIDASPVPMTCEEDPLEENDFSFDMLPMPTPDGVDGAVWQGEYDWFELPLQVDEAATATTEWPAVQGTAAVYIRDPAGVYWSGYSDTDGSLFVGVAHSGLSDDVEVWRIGVTSEYQACIDYDVTVQRLPTAGCVDDAFEPNDRRHDATPLAVPGANVGNATEWSNDVWRVEVQTDATVTFDLDYDPAFGPLSMSLFTDAALESTTPDDQVPATLSWTNDTGVTAYAYAWIWLPDGPETCNEYELSASFTF